MHNFLGFYWRVVQVAYAGVWGQARALPFYLSLPVGVAYLYGFQVSINVPTQLVGLGALLFSAATALIWAPYKVYMAEKLRADSAVSRLDQRAAYQAKANALAAFVVDGTDLLADDHAYDYWDDWVAKFNQWHNRLFAWTEASLPRAEHLQIRSIAPLHTDGVAHLTQTKIERYKNPLAARVNKLRLVTSRYQEMAYGPAPAAERDRH